MPVPVSQMWTVTSYVLRQKLAGRKQYPLVLMLEPLFRCNLACAGCGKIQYPAHILKKDLSPDECFRAVDECGAPMVSGADGKREEHALAVCRKGGYDIAADAVREALKRGFRVPKNTTLFGGANPKSL